MYSQHINTIAQARAERLTLQIEHYSFPQALSSSIIPSNTANEINQTHSDPSIQTPLGGRWRRQLGRSVLGAPRKEEGDGLGHSDLEDCNVIRKEGRVRKFIDKTNTNRSQIMPKRSSRMLLILYASRRSRPPSLADGPGFLYAFVDRGRRWKIGMSKNFVRRKREWNRQCPSSDRRWMMPVAVKRRRRAGQQTHMEIFEFNEFNADSQLVWESIVHSLLVKASTA
ncbi:hypothetical protein FB446DRAFT_709490 [Lentinula raphanica]|nr:hypothetical protein FB446DRAFT_709490 [Lentinula raphanica]